MQSFFHFRSDQFPPAPGEDEEVVNPGMYGRTFCEYLQQKLSEQGWTVPFITAEDWGWWVQIESPGTPMGICCYRGPEPEPAQPCEFACCTSPLSNRRWSWRQFRYIDLGDDIRRLEEAVAAILEGDPRIEFLGVRSEFPM